MKDTAAGLRISPRTTLALGIVLLAAWGVIQFGLAPATGWIHLLLAGGVVLVIRGIALNDE